MGEQGRNGNWDTPLISCVLGDADAAESKRPCVCLRQVRLFATATALETREKNRLSGLSAALNPGSREADNRLCKHPTYLFGTGGNGPC